MEKRGESVTVYTNFFFMDNNSPRFSLALITFSALYMLIAIMAAIRQGNTEFVFYIVVMAVLITSLVLVHRRVNFSSGVLCPLPSNSDKPGYCQVVGCTQKVQGYTPSNNWKVGSVSIRFGFVSGPFLFASGPGRAPFVFDNKGCSPGPGPA